MNLDEFKIKLIQKINNSTNGMQWKGFIINKDNKDTVNYIKSLYPSLNNINEILYLFINNMNEPPLCCVCKSKYASFVNIKTGYLKHCGCRCAQLDPNTNNVFRNNNCMKDPKFRKQKEDRYEEKHGKGIRNPFQLEKNKEKAKQTKLEKYNDPNYNNREKAAETSLNLYGATTYIHSERGKEEFKTIMMDKFGVEHHWLDQEINEKRVNTIKENNGGMGNASPKIKEKVENTLFKKTGYKHNWSDPECREKCYDTCEKLYGIKHPVLLHPPDSQSKAEKEIVEFIKTFYNGLILENDRKRLNGWELDIWIPELNKAIEYDGTYWHSSLQAHTRDTYKDKLCEKENINLLRIKEEDYTKDKENQKEIIKTWITQN